jgi:hypothetical protein
MPEQRLALSGANTLLKDSGETFVHRPPADGKDLPYLPPEIMNLIRFH